ncbi:MAG: hypothetical protein GXO10_04970 [Crenarchaeota archaeon]|nr:hypothetical protein [Thermoproteota archaeon]
MYLVKTDHPFDLVEFSKELGLDRWLRPDLDVRVQTIVLGLNGYVTVVVVRKEALEEISNESDT